MLLHKYAVGLLVSLVIKFIDKKPVCSLSFSLYWPTVHQLIRSLPMKSCQYCSKGTNPSTRSCCSNSSFSPSLFCNISPTAYPDLDKGKMLSLLLSPFIISFTDTSRVMEDKRKMLPHRSSLGGRHHILTRAERDLCLFCSPALILVSPLSLSNTSSSSKEIHYPP